MSEGHTEQSPIPRYRLWIILSVLCILVRVAGYAAGVGAAVAPYSNMGRALFWGSAALFLVQFGLLCKMVDVWVKRRQIRGRLGNS